MDTRVFVLSVGMAGAIAAGTATAGQHEGHQAGTAAGPSAAQVSECRQAQPVIAGLLTATLKRLEEARLTNSAAAMRDAADDVQAALVDIRMHLAPCSVMEGAAVASPAAPATPTTPAPPAATATAGSHADHTTPAAPASRVSASARPVPAARDAHAGHSTSASAPVATPNASRASAAAPPTNIAQLKCSNAVDPKTAPRMLYQGRMYYFCTDASRAEFARDPAKFVTAPPQTAAPSAH